MKSNPLKGWRWEIFCLLVYLALTGTQLFVRPIIGLADNGDFPKVLGRLSVCDPNHEHDAYSYVYSSYILSSECYWDSHLSSSEALFVRLIKMSAVWAERPSFRITGAGKAHLAVMAIALAILLWALHDAGPAVRVAVPVLAILIFSDVAYVAYMNSFYMDTAAALFLLVTAALAVRWVLRPHAWVAIAYGISGALLALAKTQHVVTALFLAVLAIWFAVKAVRRMQAGCWIAAAAAIATGAIVSIRAAPPEVKADPLFNLVFFRLVPESVDPYVTLFELGLPQPDMIYSGTNAYSKDSPMENDAYRDRFLREVTLRRMARFYAAHPDVLWSQVVRGLRDEAPGIRPNLGNYQREDGFPPLARTRSFALWSDLRSWLLRIFPWHIVVFYFVMGIGSTLCLFRRTWAARWPLYPLVMVLVASATEEFLSSVWFDVLETSRHLFLFQVITEVLIICAVAAILSRSAIRL